MSATKTKSRGGRKPGTWISGLDNKKILAWREETHTSRSRLASHIGVSSTSVQNWETGAAIPVRQTQLQLAELMKSVQTAEEALRSLGKTNGRPPAGVRDTELSEFDNVEVAIVDATAQIVASMLASSKYAIDDVPGIIAAVRKALTLTN